MTQNSVTHKTVVIYRVWCTVFVCALYSLNKVERLNCVCDKCVRCTSPCFGHILVSFVVWTCVNSGFQRHNKRNKSKCQSTTILKSAQSRPYSMCYYSHGWMGGWMELKRERDRRQNICKCCILFIYMFCHSPS